MSVPQVPQDAAQLADLAALVAAGTITPVLDRTFPLAEAAAAMTYLETEHARAKVVLTVLRPLGQGLVDRLDGARW